MTARWLRSMRRFLAADEPFEVSGVLEAQQRHFEIVVTLIRVFYGLQFYFLMRALDKWLDWLETDHALLLWPLAPFGETPFPVLASSVVTLFAVGLGAAAWRPESRLARILAFLGLFFFAALDNSFGKIDHGFHAWIYASFFFIALPDGPIDQVRRSRSARQIYLLLFTAAQGALLAAYSLSGFWKLLEALAQMFRGEAGWLSPVSFSYLIANRLGQTYSETVLGPLFIEWPPLGAPLTYGGLYVELFAVVVLFRPSLHRLWGLLIIGLHVGVKALIEVNFTSHILLATVLLLAAPGSWAPSSFDRTWRQLPLVPSLLVLGRLLGRRRAGKAQSSQPSS